MKWHLLPTSETLLSLRFRTPSMDGKIWKAANWVTKNSHKHTHLFRLILPMELPKIMGLQDNHSPDALWHHCGLAFCPWCGKEGQNESTINNHLQIAHYQLGLICDECLYYFTSSETMHHHSQAWKNSAGGQAEEDDEDEEHNKDGNDDSTLD